MKREMRGLRMREWWTMFWALVWPAWLLLDRLVGGIDHMRWWIGITIAMVAITIASCVVEDHLEANGRYVPSGFDVSIKDIGRWIYHHLYVLTLGTAVASCILIAVSPDCEVTYRFMAVIAFNAAWTLVIMPRD